MSIRWRLAAGIVLAFVATLAVIFITVQFSLREILKDKLDSDLATNAQYMHSQILIAGLDPLALSPRIQAAANATEGRDPFITVIRDTSGNVIAATDGVQTEFLALSDDDFARVVAQDAVVERTLDLPGDKQHRVRTESLSVFGQVVVVQVAQPTSGIVAPLDTLIIILIAEGIGATILVLGIALWLSRGATKPLQRVIDVAADIQASDLTRRIAVSKQPAEVQKLADTFDAMLARLERQFQEQQDFVMDVSHEIRTPLTVLKGNIDLMLMDKSIDAETRDRFERMSGEVSRMIRLTSNLLYIAGADAGREPERRPVELDVVCLEVLRQSRELRPDVRAALGDEDQVTVTGDRDQLKQMVLNLVENAVKYTPAGGEVRLSFGSDGDAAFVRVKDTGPGIPADMLPHIFERFYRGNHRSKMGGTGLGLAIADRIARSHGGAIEVETKVGAGSTFTVRLPASASGSTRAPASGRD